MSNASSNPDSIYGCAGCDRPDTADDIVQCDKCAAWWHYSCAKVDASVADRTCWMCIKCSTPPPPPRSTTIRTTSSNRRALLAINLQRLAEEKELRKKELEISMEKEFVKAKYDLLEQCALDDEAESHSVRDRIEEFEARDRERHVNDWVGQVAASLQKSRSLTDPKILSIPKADSTPADPFHLGKATAVDTTKTNVVLDVIDDRLSEVNDRHKNKEPPRRAVVVKRSQNRRDENATANENQKQLEMQLQKCQENSISDHQIIKDLQNQLRRCQLQLQQRSEEPQVPDPQSIWPLRDVSRGAVPKKKPTIQTMPAPAESQHEQPRTNFARSTEIDLASIPQQPQLDNYGSHEQSRTNFARSTEIGLASTPQQTQSSNHGGHEQMRTSFARSAEIGLANSPMILQSSSYNQVADSLFLEVRRPPPEQLAARQVMPRDLPDFYGDPEEWPLFISSLRNSTSACGYSRVENLARLQRCLKGNALKSVRYNLLDPESVPEVIRTLQTLYGRPEVIISKLIKTVRDAPAPKSERLETLIDFGMAVRNLVCHLIAADQRSHLSNPVLLQELVEKLPASVKMQWAQHLIQFPDMTLQTFSNFMSSVVESVSKVVLYTGSQSHRPEKQRSKEKGYSHAHVEAIEPVQQKIDSPKPCPVCGKADHRIKDCDSFKRSSVDSRWKTVSSLKLCRCCLGQHGRRVCRSSARCEVDGCQYRHHRLLHPPKQTNSNNASTTNTTESHTYHHCEQSILFRIIPVTVTGPSKTIDTFAFLDEGSSATLVEQSLAEQLELQGPVIPLCLKWTADVSRSEERSQIVSLEISESGRARKYRLDNARTVERLNLPTQTLCFEELQEKYQHLAGLPIRSYTKAIPRLLIGLRNLSLAVPQKIREGNGGPIAVKTRIGWCVYGNLTENREQNHFSYHICECDAGDKLDNLIREYFDAEDTGLRFTEQIESDEMQRAKSILERTTKRNKTRFTTGLLWKYDHIELPDSFPMALQRLKCLERRMARDPILKDNLHKQLKEYEHKGYTHQASTVELNEADPRRTWYLPLGIVVNPKKPTKVRLIWDAAAKVDGVSLNTFLLPGPDLLVSLLAVLFRFRQYPVAVCGDIKEMFHQIGVIAADRHAQRFLWRETPEEPPKVFLMDVLTFGSASSPSSAQFVKNRNAKEHEAQFPRAAEGIVKCHYVDDYLDSFEDEVDAKLVAEQVRQVHSNGGFEIRNWSSNSMVVLEHLGEASKVAMKDLTAAGNGESEKVLGMLWITETDMLCFSTTFRADIDELIRSKARPTKRQILRTVMSLFDPLGLLASFLVHGKILMQNVWRSGIKWD